MKKVLSLLIICVLIGCSEKRVLKEELINKGSKISPIYYSEDRLFSGVMYDVNSNGILLIESVIKNGKKNGLHKEWYENGQIIVETNFKNGKEYGLYKMWYDNGQIMFEWNYKNGVQNGVSKHWDEDGRLLSETN